jgi:hypothetical protein
MLQYKSNSVKKIITNVQLKVNLEKNLISLIYSRLLNENTLAEYTSTANGTAA